MTEFYLLGSVIVFICLVVVVYYNNEVFNNLRDDDNISRLFFIFILSCLSWVSILTWVYIRIRRNYEKRGLYQKI